MYVYSKSIQHLFINTNCYTSIVCYVCMYAPLHLLAGVRAIISVEVGDTVIILLEIPSETREYLVEAT